jgi:hypothetical protein
MLMYGQNSDAFHAANRWPRVLSFHAHRQWRFAASYSASAGLGRFDCGHHFSLRSNSL